MPFIQNGMRTLRRYLFKIIYEYSDFEVEALRDELQQKLAVQKASRKAKDAVDEENADVSKLERRLQTVYSSLALQKVEADRLKNVVGAPKF